MSKQAFYKRLKNHQKQLHNEQIIIKLVKQCRNKIGLFLGAKKLYHELKNKFKNLGIKIGRDKFFTLLKNHKLLIKRNKNYHVTTNSKHMFYKYKNLIKDKVPTRAEQVWVTDITYIKTDKGHAYLALVTDAYSKQIMGYKIDNNMKTELCLDALKMAIKNRKYPNQKLIHHSDRGLQYCNPTYTKFAEDNGIIMSMTEQYDPYENAIAERINRTLKYEYGLKHVIKNLKLAKTITKKAVEIYNNLRPHCSLDLCTPKQVHLNQNINYKSYRRNKNKLELLTL
ncbi:IS3 family transposase [Wenyingzhuangia fucanilytica]|uniref:IS3 family transposase n=1 Tax=Wenyingzhuangia fucanilytica TaxID=1790137 RepID=UPI001F01A778|nr:IS3 family transposase [Wenyingzhuangia fucanilytica]